MTLCVPRKPFYFSLLPQFIEPIHKIVVLGDREFCNVDLAKWLSQKPKVYLSLRLKKNEYVELEEQIWFQLSDLGLAPGMSVYYQGVKVTKTIMVFRVEFSC